MKTSKAILMGLALTASMAACNTHDDGNPTGTWTSASPEVVTATVADATSATKTTTIDFVAPVDKAAGELTLTADYDVTGKVYRDTVETIGTYKVTASIKGTWTKEGHSHDDYLLTFDQNTLSVQGTDAPELGPVTDDFLRSLTTMTSIEDVEVSKDGTHMTFETEHPDVKYHFVKK